MTAKSQECATTKKIIGVDSDNESTKSVSTGESERADEMALIEEDIAEAGGISRKGLIY